MTASNKPRPYPMLVRLLLGVLALLFIALTFKVMLALSQPSQYINAHMVVQKEPGLAKDLMNLGILNFRSYLYLVGPILDAKNEKSKGPLFNPEAHPVLRPSVFTDQSGAVEILSHSLPITPQEPGTYRYGHPLHLLGWRVSDSGFRLYAVAESKESLSDILYQRSENWKTTLFAQGLLLAGMVFAIFWLLNIAVLSNPSLQLVQLLIVNLIFLVLFYSVMVLARYPLTSTVIQTLEILALANLVFFPLSLLLSRRRAA